MLINLAIRKVLATNFLLIFQSLSLWKVLMETFEDMEI